MLVSLIKGNKIKNLELPSKVTGNFWITDNDDLIDNKIIKIESSNGRWCLLSNDNISIIESGKEKRYTFLREYSFYLLRNKKNNTYILIYCSPIYDTTYRRYSLINTQEITIGKGNNTYIYYNTSGVDELHAKIVFKDNKYIILDNNSRLGVYVNSKRIYQKKILENGDVIFIAGMKMILSINNKVASILVNNPDNLVKCRLNEIEKDDSKYSVEITDEDDEVIESKLYKKTDYFNNKYRKNNTIDTYDIYIKDKEEDVGINSKYKIIPIVILCLITLSSLLLTLTNNLKNGFVIFIALCLITLLWPLFVNIYYRRKNIKADEEYEHYLDSKNEQLNEQGEIQKSILLKNSKDVDTCQKIILENRKELWERKRNDNDFLNINLGYTSLPMDAKIKTNNTEFKNKILTGVPLTISLLNDRFINFVGSIRINRFLIQEIILQLVALHRYDDLKIVLFTSDKYKDKWDFIKILPHNFSNDKKIRFFATDSIEINEVCNYLNKKLLSEDNEYYVVISDNIEDLYKYSFINKTLSNKYNNISLIIMNEDLNSISKYCDHIVDVNDKESIYYENKLNGMNQTFNINFSTKFSMYECSRRLANKPIHNLTKDLPEYYSLMDMYRVGNIEDLNVYNRWNTNNSEISLKTKIGVDTIGEDIYLDLHKEYDGSHCIIEGVPGSGKTEFITTYILSMAINYNPNDVQFIVMSDNNLNDLFYDKLPHLVASVSYDKYSLKRFMASFKSELIKRQNLFTTTSQMFDVNNVDIYKYQQLYHNKLVNIPVAHLFVVIDEYEKLLKEHPTFISNLLKVSHIGPILGIHYIFTTDKKNSNYDIDIFNTRICMYNINTGDNLVNYPGQFYLYHDDEVIHGMSATGNSIYKPKKVFVPKYDSSVEFINNVGKVIKKKDRIRVNSSYENNSTESNTLIRFFSSIDKYNVNKLLLDKLDDYITVASLMKKYEVSTKRFSIEPIIGEYEDLNNHKHGILRIPMSNSNSIVYSKNKNELETLISSIIFSSMYLYSPEEVNYYLIDFNESNLSIFSKSPLIGDIVKDDNNDKINNLFKLIQLKIEERKVKFKEYDNSYINYIENSGKVLPLIVIIINNYSLFNERYNSYVDSFIKLLEDGDYGIRFVLATNEYTSYDIACKFDNIYVLKQDNNRLYNKILNSNVSIYPEEVFGRGLTKVNNNICEFQTSYCNPKNKDYIKFVNEQCINCKKEYTISAQNIPVLPEKLTFKQVRHELGKSNEMIIGYNTSLKLIKYNFNDKNLSVISGLNMDIISKFVNPLIKQFAYLNKNDVIVIDASNNNLGNNINNLKYINNDFDNSIVLLENYLENIYKLSKNTDNEKNRTIFINGLSNLYKELSEEYKDKFNELLLKTRELSTINIILVDNYEKIKELENLSWYKCMVNLAEGIWVGSGIEIQNLFVNRHNIQNNIKNNWCYVISSGIPVLTQYVESFDILDS